MTEQCLVCMRRPREVRVQCGHLFACAECIRSISVCAICRTKVTALFHVRRSRRHGEPGEKESGRDADAETFSNPDSVRERSGSDNNVVDASSGTESVGGRSHEALGGMSSAGTSGAQVRCETQVSMVRMAVTLSRDQLPRDLQIPPNPHVALVPLARAVQTIR